MCSGGEFVYPLLLMSKGESIWYLNNVYVSTGCGDKTPTWLPSSPNWEIVGNMILMIAYVFLDGNSLANDEVYDFWRRKLILQNSQENKSLSPTEYG